MPVSRTQQRMRRLASAMLLSMITSSSAQLPDSQDYLTETDLSGFGAAINSVTHLPQKRSDAPSAVSITDWRVTPAIPSRRRSTAAISSTPRNY